MRTLAATRSGAGVPVLPGEGCVVGLFGQGFYVQACDRLFAVGGPKLPAGPLHLVLAEPPPLPRENSRVSFEPGRMHTATCTLDISLARAYDPAPPPHDRLDAISASLSCLDRPDYVPADLACVWRAVRAAPDLDAARHLLEGRGAGLTPTGDDVLAALLLFACWACPGSPGPTEVARTARTTDLSRNFLFWAANGQSIEPVHQLVAAAERLAASSERTQDASARNRFDAAVAIVAAIGGSSGRAILAGLGLAARAWSNRHEASR